MENPVVLITSSEEEDGGGGEGNGSKEKRRASHEERIRSKVDEYREIADLSGFENLKSMILAETFMSRKKRNRKKKKKKEIEYSYRELTDLTGFENLKAMMEAEAAMKRKNRNRKKKKSKTQFSAQEDVTVNVALEKEQLGKDEALNIVKNEEGNGRKKKNRRNGERNKSKVDECQKFSDLSDFENLKAIIEAEAFLRWERRNRKNSKGKIELCAQEDVTDDTEEGVGQLAEDKTLKMVEASKSESVWISEMTQPQNLVTDAAKEYEGGSSVKTLQTTKPTGADDGVNSVEVIVICSSPSEDDESVSDVSLGRSFQDTGKATQTTKATGVEDAVNSVELEVIDLFSSSSEEYVSISDVSVGINVEDAAKTVLTTTVTRVNDRENYVEVIDLFSSFSENHKSNSEGNLGKNVEDMEPVDPVVREKKRKRRRKKTKLIKASGTIDNEGDDVKNNIVLRMLLRKPRYFDPLDWKLETCSNCGKENHTAVSCKAQKWNKPCFLCGSLKHIWKYCRKGQDCFISKGTGYRAYYCLETDQGNHFNSNICLRCGDSGHDMFPCNSDYPADDLKEIQCYVCKSFGHLCCVNPSNVVLKQVSCYNCGQSGHFGPECTKSGTAPGGTESAIKCYKCGEEGHFARRCNGHITDRLRISDLLPNAERLPSKVRFFSGSSSALQP